VTTPRLLAEWTEPIELHNPQPSSSLPDVIRRLPIPGPANVPLRISAEVRTEGVPGTPGMESVIFFNLEYASGPVFWDMFLYPDTGTTPWRTLSCDCRARGDLRTAELHIRFHAKGRLSIRNLRVEALEPWADDADAVVAVFGDSTDMTCYLPTEHRLTRRLELLLRDRFGSSRIDVHGLAEGGETLKRIVESGRLDRELQSLPRCDIAMIRYGLNDRNMNVPPETFTPLLNDACDRILRRFPKARIVLSTTLPAPGSEVFSRQTEAVARERKLPLIDLASFMRDLSKAGNWDWHNDPNHKIGRPRRANPPDNIDGLKGDLHPNAYGSQLIAECYFKHLEPLLAARLGIE
jgi:lysophospholipase L1-like esterase